MNNSYDEKSELDKLADELWIPDPERYYIDLGLLKIVSKLDKRHREILLNPNSPVRFNSRGEDISGDIKKIFLRTIISEEDFIDALSAVYPDLPEKTLTLIYGVFLIIRGRKRIEIASMNI